MPLARDLHPEFGYVGSAPRLCRKLGLVLAFIVFGLVAGASGVAVFVANPDPDPMHAMALAPAEALIGATRSSPTATVENKVVEAPSAQKAAKASAIKSPCRENADPLGGDCIPVRAVKPRPVQAVNERPAIAAVPIGHRDGPAVLPSEPAISVAAAPATLDGSSVNPADTAPPAEAAPAPAVVESPAPAAPPKKARTRSNQAQVQRRERNEYSPSYSYHNNNFQGGYARVW